MFTLKNKFKDFDVIGLLKGYFDMRIFQLKIRKGTSTPRPFGAIAFISCVTYLTSLLQSNSSLSQYLILPSVFVKNISKCHRHVRKETFRAC